jgi:spore maturation protein CgeB
MFVSPARMAKLFRSHIACLNLLTPENTLSGLNLRAFEIPMCGGVGTYPDVPDVRACFVPGTEILLYRTLEELKGSVDELIAQPEKAEAIAVAGHRRVLQEHTWRHRAASIVKEWLPGAPFIAPS